MKLVEAKDIFGNVIHLTSESWNHIIQRHPELSNKLDNLKEVIENPDYITKSKFDENCYLYQKYYKFEHVYLTVVAIVSKGFVITAYLSTNVKEGLRIWQK